MSKRPGSTRKWREKRARLFSLAGNRCTAPRDGTRCPHAAHALHHIIAVADGGSDHESNLTPVCQPCHDILTLTQNQARQRAAALPNPSRDW